MKTDYLRVSVTDRCNLECVYCHPLCGCDFVEHREMLRLEEIHRVVRLFVESGVRKIRLTGGEPLVRRNIIYLVRRLAMIEGLDELALTTNGVLLRSMAAELKDAGVHRVNVSLSSVERESYRQITGFDLQSQVTEGICKALEAGLGPVKINSVIIRGINFSQIIPLAKLSIGLPLAVRFIEYCPTSRYTRPAGDYVPTKEVCEIIEREFGHLSPVPSDDGPASCFRIKDAAGTIGFISGRSSIFCESCNRLRLTSDGKVKPCLYSSKYWDIKGLIRAGASDGELLGLIRTVMQEKHSYTKLNSPAGEFSMREIGG